MLRRIGPAAFLITLASFSLVIYLYASRALFRIGFPLDDAWIHQTYARNLAFRGEWAFLPGQPSAGSTAPLWSFLLAVGYWLGLSPYIWTFFLGWVLLACMALMGSWVFRALCPDSGIAPLWVGSFLALEWHLVWAAGSGMETLLAALIGLLVFFLCTSNLKNSFLLGLVVGLNVWVRPDGITLIGPAAVTVLFHSVEDRRRKAIAWKGQLWELVKLLLGMLLCFIPYLAFNFWLDGNLWPNTFFAKQAEYAIYQELPLWERWVKQAGLPLVGAGALLVPGWLAFIEVSFRLRNWAMLAFPVWVAGYMGLYAWRLPVTYQHGRYIMPVIPVYLVCSLVGMAFCFQPGRVMLWQRVLRIARLIPLAAIYRFQSNCVLQWQRVLKRAWLVSIVVVLLLFWLVGAQAYARDVAIIESEMVVTAQWIHANTDEQVLVAAHDIGALGYFSQRRLLDLAGLVSPDVIPFIRDETRLKKFLDVRGADYLATFPGWYPELAECGRLVFITGSQFSPSAGGENMAIYKWISP